MGEQPPAIKSCVLTTPRPLFSVMIPTYERTEHLAETLRSVLAQDMGPAVMQIAVLDNHSQKADIAGMVNDIGGGRIEFHRHGQNLGMVGNLNACIDEARGEWVHILHDDDYVAAGFYAALRAGIEASPGAGVLCCRCRYMNSAGEIMGVSPPDERARGLVNDVLWRMARGNFLQFCSVVVRRGAYEAVGGFDPALRYVIDAEMWVRLAARFPVWFEPETLATYRVHALSATHKLIVNSEDCADMARGLVLIRKRLPAGSPPRVMRAAHAYAADLALHHTRVLSDIRPRGVPGRLRWALRFDPGLRTGWRCCRLGWRTVRRGLLGQRKGPRA